MKHKALFAIREIKSGKLLSAPMFEDKQLAKALRRSLNRKNEEGEEILAYVIAYGPDHDKFDPTDVKFIHDVKLTEVKHDRNPSQSPTNVTEEQPVTI